MKCDQCGCPTIGDNLICDNCRNGNDYEEDDFYECSECDGNPACHDFGCAIELGLRKMIKNDYETL